MKTLPSVIRILLVVALLAFAYTLAGCTKPPSATKFDESATPTCETDGAVMRRGYIPGRWNDGIADIGADVVVFRCPSCGLLRSYAP